MSTGVSGRAEGVSGRANTVAAAAEEMSADRTSVAAVVGQTAANVPAVSTAAAGMAATIKGIQKNADKARSITTNAVARSEEASERVDRKANVFECCRPVPRLRKKRLLRLVPFQEMKSLRKRLCD